MKDPQTEELLTESITFRCTPALKEFIYKSAKSEGRRPSQWIVWQIQTILEEQAEKAAKKQDSPEGNSSFSHELRSGEASLAAS